jgi:muramoyltetrapeptide carboxypeptidase
MKIAIVAPSSVVPRVEVEVSAKRLRSEGFDVDIYAQCRKRHLFFAGTDDERVEAFLSAAQDPAVDIVWAGRGGYGAARLLDGLKKAKRIPVGKLFVGYSDSTALLSFVQKEWGWRALHATMPSLRAFPTLSGPDWTTLLALLRGDRSGFVPLHLKFANFAREVKAPLTGGNLAVFTSLVGTSYLPSVRGKIVFFEEVGESLYRVDRMVNQLRQSGALAGAKAIILGDFTQCDDSVPSVLASKKGDHLKPLRPRLQTKATLKAIFSEIGDELRIPVAFGVPAGHGDRRRSLPFWGMYRLSRNGVLSVHD